MASTAVEVNAAESQSPDTASTGKTLVVYFSHTGNTKAARDIVSALPLTINAKDWEDKAYYGRIRSDVSTDGVRHNQLQAGDLVY